LVPSSNTVVLGGHSEKWGYKFLKQKEIKPYREKWLQHVQRMDTNRISKQALQYKSKGRRNIGGPRKRWRDQFHFEDQGTGNTPNPSRTLLLLLRNKARVTASLSFK